MGKRTIMGRYLARGFKCAATFTFVLVATLGVQRMATAAQSSKKLAPPITVRFTDVRNSAGITFRQDSTQTEEKYYLETMGTGVAWLDYDQDGLMDLYFVQS